MSDMAFRRLIVQAAWRSLLWACVALGLSGCTDPDTAGVFEPLPTLTPTLVADAVMPTPLEVMRSVFGTPRAVVADAPTPEEADAAARAAAMARIATYGAATPTPDVAADVAPLPAPHMVFVAPVAPGVAAGTRDGAAPEDVF